MKKLIEYLQSEGLQHEETVSYIRGKWQVILRGYIPPDTLYHIVVYCKGEGLCCLQVAENQGLGILITDK